MAVAVIALPPLIHHMGIDRFGILSLAWIIVGYFSLFDLGLGRALTKLIADKLGAQDHQSIPSTVWTALLLLLLGTAGGLIAAAISPWLIHRVLKVPVELQGETLSALYLLAGTINIVTVSCGLRGVLEAQQRFRILNLIRIPTSIFSFVGPLLVLPFSHRLVPVILVLSLGRLVSCGVHLIACLRSTPGLRRNISLDPSLVKPLIKFGGWMTVTNVVGPFMLYMDRFEIGALLSIGVVSYYTVPFDLVNRISVIPAAISSVLFPAFAATIGNDRDRTHLLISRGVKYIFMSVFPIALLVITFAPDFLRIWLGSEFAQNSELPMRWLAAGMFVISLATIPFVLVQSAGRPDITAKLQIAELPLYLGVLWVMTKRFGIEGTAITWVGRVIVDGILLFFFSQRLLPLNSKLLAKVAMSLSAALLSFYVVTIPEKLLFRIILLSAISIAFGLMSWRWGLDAGEKKFLQPRMGIPARIPVN